MACPRPKVLSQWVDGSLHPREAANVYPHIQRCAACRQQAEELRKVGAWLETVSGLGPDCLTPEEMAAVLEGGQAPAHLRTCPRCATEFRALRPPERKATRRHRKQPASRTAWVAAAAIFLAVGILFAVTNTQSAPPAAGVQARIPSGPAEPPSSIESVRPPQPPPTLAVPQVPSESPVRRDPVKIDSVPLPAPAPAPSPAPPRSSPPPVVVEAPVAPPPKPEPPDLVVPTPADPIRPVPALNIRAGGLSTLAEGKWVKPPRLEEGIPMRAEGHTQLEFSQARITLDGSSRFTVSKNEFSLSEGAMSGEVSTGSKFTLVLDEQRISPQTSNGRVLFSARPDRICVEEGTARVKDTTLHEGVEHVVRKDRIEPQKRRTLFAAARPREVVTWKMNLANENVVRRNIGAGHVEKDTPEGKMLVSDAVADNPYMYGSASYFNGLDLPPLFTVKATTAIRFRYYMTQPGTLELVLKNGTKEENFNKPLEPVIRQWTTVTLYARDVPANPGGKKVTCEVGDRYTGISWFVGRPRNPSEVYIDRLEILEIER
jgi:hypothetical protein